MVEHDKFITIFFRMTRKSLRNVSSLLIEDYGPWKKYPSLKGLRNISAALHMLIVVAQMKDDYLLRRIEYNIYLILYLLIRLDLLLDF